MVLEFIHCWGMWNFSKLSYNGMVSCCNHLWFCCNHMKSGYNHLKSRCNGLGSCYIYSGIYCNHRMSGFQQQSHLWPLSEWQGLVGLVPSWDLLSDRVRELDLRYRSLLMCFDLPCGWWKLTRSDHIEKMSWLSYWLWVARIWLCHTTMLLFLFLVNHHYAYLRLHQMHFLLKSL